MKRVLLATTLAASLFAAAPVRADLPVIDQSVAAMGQRA